MMNNPEFKRNIWLELSTHRLIAAPVILGLIFFVLMQNGDANGSGAVITNSIAKSIFVIATMLWGSHLAFASVSDELQNRTWDNQRMSALSPFKLAWGKLFGATSFAWYIGIPCVIVMLLTPSINNQNLEIEVVDTSLVISLVLGALFAQALAFVSALSAAKSNAALPRGISLLFLFVLMPMVGSMLLGKSNVDALWYGQNIDRHDFINASLLAFTAWTWLACYRVMQAALQIKIKPWAMLGFVLFSAFYLLGFYKDVNIVSFASVAFVLAVLTAYLGAATEKRDLVSVRRCINPWLARNPAKALKETPYFVVMTVFSCVALFFTLLGVKATDGFFEKNMLNGEPITLLGLVIILLMLRDIGLLYYFSLSKKPQRALMTTFFYLIVLYVLLPLLLPNSVGLIAFPLKSLTQSTGVYGALALAVVHVAVVAGLLYKQHHGMNKSLAS
jgi:hypothetical protein